MLSILVYDSIFHTKKKMNYLQFISCNAICPHDVPRPSEVSLKDRDGCGASGAPAEQDEGN